MAIKPLISSIPFRPDTRNVIGFRANLPSVDLPGVRQLARTAEEVGVRLGKERGEKEATEEALKTPLEKDPVTGAYSLPKPSEEWGTYKQEIFTDLLRKRYLTQVNSDLNVKLAAVDFTSDPIEARRKSEEIIAAQVKNVDPSVAAVVAERGRQEANSLTASALRRGYLKKEYVLTKDTIEAHASKMNESLKRIGAGDSAGGLALLEEARTLGRTLFESGKIGPEAWKQYSKIYDLYPTVGVMQLKISELAENGNINKPSTITALNKIVSALGSPTEEKILGYDGRVFFDLPDGLKNKIRNQITSLKAGLRSVGGVDEDGMTPKQAAEAAIRKTEEGALRLSIPSDKDAKAIIRGVVNQERRAGNTVSSIRVAERLGLASKLVSVYSEEVKAAPESAEKSESVYQIYREMKSGTKSKNYADVLIGGTSPAQEFAKFYKKAREQGLDPKSAYVSAQESINAERDRKYITDYKRNISNVTPGTPTFGDIESALAKQFGKSEWNKLSINAKIDIYKAVSQASDKTIPLSDAVKNGYNVWNKQWVKNKYALRGATAVENGLPFVVKEDGSKDFSYLDSVVLSIPKYVDKTPDGKVKLNGATNPVDPQTLRMGVNIFVQKIPGEQNWMVLYKPKDGLPSQILVNNGTAPLTINPSKIVKKENLAVKEAQIQNSRAIVDSQYFPKIPIINTLERKARELLPSRKVEKTIVLEGSKPATPAASLGGGILLREDENKFRRPEVSFYSRKTNIDLSEVATVPLAPGFQEAKKLLVTKKTRQQVLDSLDQKPKIPFPDKWIEAPQIKMLDPQDQQPKIPLPDKFIEAPKLDTIQKMKIQNKLMIERSQKFR